MRLLICILLLPFLLLSQKDETGFGKHYIAGALISAQNAASLSYFYKGNKRFNCCFFGSMTGISAGIAKEKIYDNYLKKGNDSFDDLMGTAFGSVVYIGAFFFVTTEIKKTKIDTTKYNNL